MYNKAYIISNDTVKLIQSTSYAYTGYDVVTPLNLQRVIKKKIIN